jgi:hypothetical protein
MANCECHNQMVTVPMLSNSMDGEPDPVGEVGPTDQHQAVQGGTWNLGRGGRVFFITLKSIQELGTSE